MASVSRAGAGYVGFTLLGKRVALTSGSPNGHGVALLAAAGLTQPTSRKGGAIYNLLTYITFIAGRLSG